MTNEDLRLNRHLEDVLATMRRLARRGADADAAELADALEPKAKREPAVALARARARMREGDLLRAREALDAMEPERADAGTGNAGERLILTLESAYLLILERSAFRLACRAAQEAWKKPATARITEVEGAEARRVQARIELSAAVFFEAEPGKKEQIVAELPLIAKVLEEGGRVGEGLAARLIWAERQTDPETVVSALDEVIRRAKELEWPEYAAEALLRQGEHLAKVGGSTERIRELYEQAAKNYDATGHVYGSVDVQAAQARLSIEREFAATEKLAVLVEDYLRLRHPRGALTLLTDLAQIEHLRGNMPGAAAYRRRAFDLAEGLGMLMTRDTFRLGQADLLMRSNRYSEAIDLCQAALGGGMTSSHVRVKDELPTFHRAAYQQLLATAYSFVGNAKEALHSGREAIRLFEELEAMNSASVVVAKLANDLANLRRDEASDEAEALLTRWIGLDLERKDTEAAIRKYELLAQTMVNEFQFSPTRSRQPNLLDRAEAALSVGDRLTEVLRPYEAAQRKGGLLQVRGQVLQARGDTEKSEALWRESWKVYESAGLKMETANARFMIGVIRLNRANEQLMPHFGESEDHLKAALGFYETTGMRSQAADARYMLAQLYTNAAQRVREEFRDVLCKAAFENLEQGEAQYDAIRREYSAAAVLETQRGKRSLIEKSRRIYDLALRLITNHLKDAQLAWDWTQRAKGRTLSDTLGTGSKPPEAVLKELEAYPESLASVMHERELTVRLAVVPSHERAGLQQELATWQIRMMGDAHLEKYLSLRAGRPISADEMREVLRAEEEQGRSFVCVDWISIGERLWLIAFRAEEAPEMVELPLTLQSVRDFVRGSLGQENYRGTVQRNPEFLRALDGLIAPLATLTRPGEYLLLSPTGPLHAVPLHALHLGGEPLLVRNGVAYCPCLSVLRYSVMQSKPRPLSSAALLGDPNGDRSEAASLVEEVGRWWGVEPLRGEAVTSEHFQEAVGQRSLVHFQGHARYDRTDPLNSELLFAGGSALSAREVFDLPTMNVDLLTLAACESAATLVEAGDEPIGLIPAFLYAGAKAVVATLWRVRQDSAAKMMLSFYREILGEHGRTGRAGAAKIDALRTAALAVRATPGFETEYHWAPFVLNGDWR